MDVWHPQNFRLCNVVDPSEKGVCYADDQRTWVDLAPHSSLADLMDTCTHESIHAAIARLGEDGHSGDAEHLMIRNVEFAADDLI